MRPAYTNVFPLVSPGKNATAVEILQVPNSLGRSHAMLRLSIRLYDADRARQDRWARELRNCGSRVVTCDPLIEESPQAIEAALPETDLLYFDLTVRNRHTYSTLILIASYRWRYPASPPIICYAPDADAKLRYFLKEVLVAEKVEYGW